MLTFEEEKDLLNDVREGASIALYESELEGDIGDIELNKLGFRAIQDFKLNVTYGWFKFGPAPFFVDSETSGEVTTVTPRATQEIQAAESPRIPTVDNTYRSPEEYAFYFLNDIYDEFEEAVTMDAKEYLVLFYERYAPPKYRDLYIESVRFQQDLDRLKEASEWFEESEEQFDAIEKGLSNVYRELLQIPDLSESVEAFQRYSRILKDVLIAANSLDELTAEQQRFIAKLVDFFYGKTWEYPALLISQDTVAGDNKNDLKKASQEDLQTLRDSYDKDVETVRKQASRFDLLPEAVEERKQLVKDQQELPRQEDDPDTIDAWTMLSGEVIMNDECK